MTKSFYSWLMQFKNDDTAIGDLARDVNRDSEFPRRSISYRHLKKYLESKQAVDVVMNVFMEAFTQYKSEVGGSIISC